LFEDPEFQKPYDALRNEGHEVVVIGRKKGEALEGHRGQVKAKTDLSIDDADVEDFDVLFIPGGYSPDNLRADPRFVNFVRDFDATGKPIAAICHGPQLLIAAGIVKGRTLTAWKTIQSDLKQIDGVKVRDEPVVRDGNWLTSRQPADIPQFTSAFIEELRSGRAAQAH
jgi:protease I